MRFGKIQENEKIVDAFKYFEKSKIVLASKEGFVFIVNSIDLFSNKKSGKKIFNVKKNDECATSCLFDDKKDKYLAVFFKDDVNNKLIIPTPADDSNATELSSPASEKTRGAK